MGNQGCCSRSRTQSFTGTGTLYRSSRIQEEDSILSLTSYSPVTQQETPTDSPTQKRVIQSYGTIQTSTKNDPYMRRKTDLPKVLAYKNLNEPKCETVDLYSQRSVISNDFGGDVHELNQNLSNIFSKPSDGRNSEVLSAQPNLNMASSQNRQSSYFHQFLESRHSTSTPVSSKLKLASNLDTLSSPYNHAKYEHQMTPVNGQRIEGMTPKFNNDNSSMCELVIFGSRAL